MSQKDPLLWSKNILSALNSDNVQYQASAILSLFQFLDDMGIKKQDKHQLLTQLIPFLAQELDQASSLLHNDCIKLLAKTGLIDFDLIKPLFPMILQEFPSKNRITLKIIMDFLANMSNSTDPLILQAFTDLITHSPEWFDKSFLIPILDNFYSVVLGKNYQFMHNYHDLLVDALNQFPPSMQAIIEKISLKKEEYDAFLHSEEEKRLAREKEQEERRLIQEQQKIDAAKKRVEQKAAKAMKDAETAKNQEKSSHEYSENEPISEEQTEPDGDVNTIINNDAESLEPAGDQDPNLLKTLKKASPGSKVIVSEEPASEEDLSTAENETADPGGFTQFGLTKKGTNSGVEPFPSFSKLGLKKKN